MIRIVDILKQSEKNNPPHEENKPSPEPLSEEEIQKFCADTVNSVKDIISGHPGEEEAKEKSKLIIPAVEILIDDPLLRKDGKALAALAGQPPENETYIAALKIMISAVNLGVDASYRREQLIELARFALVKSALGRYPAGIAENYKNIIDLAQIYETTKSA